jgi:MATE family multidrug resistance protein
MIEHANPHRGPDAAPTTSFAAEAAATVRLALPMALTQLGQVAMMTTDLILLGRLGDHLVAATALAHTVLFGAFVLGMGVVSAVAPLAAQAFGSRQPRMVRRSLRVGLWAAILLGLPLTALQLHSEPMLIALGQAPEAANVAARYLDSLAFSLIPAWCFLALRNFMSALDRPEPALWITLAAVPANAVLAYALIYGAWGFPELGVFGAGLATTLVNTGMCAAAIVVAYACRPFRKYHVLGRFWIPDWSLFLKLIVIGLPISGAFLLEFGLFAAATLMMGRLGTTALAAHQIALQTASVIFMVPFGIAMAATVRVGQAVGRRDSAATRRAGFAALAVGTSFLVLMTVVIILFRAVIPPLFLGDGADSRATAELAALLLLVGATFFVADGVQTIGAGALRGLNDTRMPLVFAAVSFWAVGFAAAYALGFELIDHPAGVWIGLSLGLAVYATLLVVRFQRLTARGYMPDLTPPGPPAPGGVTS